MGPGTERDLVPGEEETGRRRFMIAGEQIILRALEPADLERCYRWMNDPNIVWTLKSRYPQEGKLERVFFRDGAYHDIVILSIFNEPSNEGSPQ